MHRENAEGAGRSERAARRVPQIDPQHRELRIHQPVFLREAWRVRGRDGLRDVAQNGGKAADSRLTPDGPTSPRHTRRPEIGHRGVNRTGNPRRERIDHHGIEAGDRASLVIVSGGLEEMTGAGVRMGRRNNEAIHADSVGARGERRDAAVQQGRAEGEIGDDERQAIAAAVGQHEHARIESQPNPSRLSALRTVARQPHTGRRRDVHAGEAGPQRCFTGGSRRRAEGARRAYACGTTARDEHDSRRLE